MKFFGPGGPRPEAQSDPTGYGPVILLGGARDQGNYVDSWRRCRCGVRPLSIVTAQSGISERGKCYEIRVLRERKKKWFIISFTNVRIIIEISKFF